MCLAIPVLPPRMTSTRIRFYDYALVFSIPGLYNQLFGGLDSETKCISLQVIAGLLRDQLSLVLPGNNAETGASMGAGQSWRSWTEKNCHHDLAFI